MRVIVLSLALYSIPSLGFILQRNHAPPLETSSRKARRGSHGKDNNNSLTLRGSESDAMSEEACWNPKLRQTMSVIAAMGAAETAYLSWNKVAGGTLAFCDTTQEAATSCSNVLNGPYSTIPGTEVPLATAGFLAYSLVGILAILPVAFPALVDDGDAEENNRLLLTASTTCMGVFSVFLMTILFGVMKASCAYCVISAGLSIGLAKLAWLGGAVPENRIKQGLQWSASASVGAFLASVALFGSGPDPSSAAIGYAGELVAQSIVGGSTEGKAPPPVLSPSSQRALDISKELQLLDGRMYGAFWCSHCYDQKERLGKEAMTTIPYIECSREGLNNQAQLCRDKQIPGYPTWEISGKLFPGEKEFDELEDIIKQVKSS